MKEELKHAIDDMYRSWLQSGDHDERAGQRHMIEEVARTCADAGEEEDEPRPLLAIEAPPGTGKTIAYLSAAIPIARALGKKLLVSTSTIALQEQLAHEDLPQLQAASEHGFGFALAKGRGRYLCRLRLEQVLEERQGPQQQAMYPDEAPSDKPGSNEREIYRQMDQRVQRGAWDGDRDAWKETVENNTWRRVTATAKQCSGRSCTYYRNCFFYGARHRLHSEDVDCIVANHDLVLSDLLLADGSVLSPPEQTLYVFDEAHHLGDKAIARFAQEERAASGREWLQQCEKRLAKLCTHLGELATEPVTLPDVAQLFPTLYEQNENLFAALANIVPEDADGPSQKESRHLFPGGQVQASLRSMAAEAAAAFEELGRAIEQLSEPLEKIQLEAAAGAAGQQGGEQEDKKRKLAERWLPLLGEMLGQAERWQMLWKGYAEEDPDEAAPTARWVILGQKEDGGVRTDKEKGARRWVTSEWKGEVREGDGIDLRIAMSPVQGADILSEALWARCAGAVLTSATLSVAGDFKRLRQHTGLPAHCRDVVVEHAFDYSKAVLSAPRRGFDPGNSKTHTEAVTKYLKQHLPQQLKSGTGALVLFASRWQMQEVYADLPAKLQESTLMQHRIQRQEIMRRHAERIEQRQGSVIFGLASFAEGVDLPGALCTLVVIAKLPFAAPNPVSETLDRWIKTQGGNPFFDIAVPDTALRLVQACGRLLRSDDDTGRIALLDSRVLHKRYGSLMLEALPPFRREDF